MADPISFSFKRIAKRLKTYEQANAKFAGTRAMQRIAFTIAKSEGKEGIKQKYKDIFKAPVSYTLRSMNYKAKGLTADLITNDDESKGNAPAKYLFPVIGGGGNQVFATRFQDVLRNKNYMNKSDFALANFANPKIRTRAKTGRVTPNTYRNTLIGLSQTRKGNLDDGSRGGKIQDGAVYSFKQDFKQDNGKTYAKGIYRRKTTEKSSYLEPLFFFGATPSVPNKGKLNTHVKQLFENIAGKIWIEEIKKAAK
tara:strand:- start:330 stop:1088 length:759 start_codon:yes stop_codon:yes gene_type:complete